MLDELRRRWGRFYLLPEGGSNEAAVRGCAELVAELSVDFDVICCPVGTGGTLAGIAGGLRAGQHALGFSVLKNAPSLDREFDELHRAVFPNAAGTWSVEHGFPCGGYAKTSPELQAFISDFTRRHGLQLDRIYTAKMMYGLFALAEQGRFPASCRVVAVITGPGGDEASTSTGAT